MIMRVYIRTTKNGLPETEAEYTAYQGFCALGIMPKFYSDENELENCRPNDLIVGRVSTIVKRLSVLGIKIDEYDYPEELTQYLGRSVWNDTLDSIMNSEDKWPVFVKPVRDKAFVGFILRKEEDLPRLYRATQTEPVLCSELVNFLSEWRVFVRYGDVVDVRPYSGDWKKIYDPATIESAVNDFTSAPAGYAIDFGVTDKGETRLIEVNDGFALGTYGIDPIQYAKLLSARWSELLNITDECDQYFESVDWKKKKKSFAFKERQQLLLREPVKFVKLSDEEIKGLVKAGKI